MAVLPLPVATSSTRSPARRSTASQSRSLTGTIREAITWKSPEAQVRRWRALTALRSGAAGETVVAVVMGFLLAWLSACPGLGARPPGGHCVHTGAPGGASLAGGA